MRRDVFMIDEAWGERCRGELIGLLEVRIGQHSVYFSSISCIYIPFVRFILSLL